MSTLDYVAMYGAIAATVAVIWNGIAVYRDRTSIKVKVAYMLTDVFKFEPTWYISITAMNKGRRPVTLNGAGLRLSNGINLTYIPQAGELPRRLNEGEKYDAFLEKAQLKEDIKKLEPNVVIKFAWVRDETDRLYKSKFPKKMEKDLRG